jgi:peptidoglycan/LPS O-acetylase OafA/YrhL
MKPATTRAYYPSLDGLRGIAIILVLFCHTFDFIPFVHFAYVGVDLFFVLSGFLITDILLRTRDNKNFLQNFFIRRILRIFPLYYGTLLIFFLFVPFIPQLHEQYKYYHDNQGMTWFHLINWLYIFNPRPTDSMLFGHFWSLSVEEQFYILWPFLILLCRNLQRLKMIIYSILIIGIGARFSTWLYWGGNYTGYSFQYMTRFDGLCVGSLIAIWKISNPGNLAKQFLLFLLTVIGIHGCLFILSRTLFTGLPHFILLGYTGIAAIFGLLVLSATSKTLNVGKQLLENKGLIYIGKISYGLYVFHWPVFILLRFSFQGSLLKTGISLPIAQSIIAVATLITATLISALSYTLFETRILALKEKLTGTGYFAKLRQKLQFLMGPASAK